MSKVLIKSATGTFRRAGISATRDGIEVDIADLSEAQIKAINDEPRLAVYVVDEDGKATSKAVKLPAGDEGDAGGKADGKADGKVNNKAGSSGKKGG